MPIDLIRATLKGTAIGGESWSINPVYIFGDFDQPTPTFEEMSAAAQAAADVTPGNNLRALLSTGLSYTGMRLEGRRLNGDLEIIGEATRGAPSNGSGVMNKPYQTSVVFSLRTAVPGARGRGRLYWPALAATLTSTTGRWDTAQQTSCTAEMAQFLEDIGAAMAVPLGFPAGFPAVWSRTGLSRAPIINVSAGDVFDTQRRRRDRAVESYVTSVYPPP